MSGKQVETSSSELLLQTKRKKSHINCIKTVGTKYNVIEINHSSQSIRFHFDAHLREKSVSSRVVNKKYIIKRLYYYVRP